MPASQVSRPYFELTIRKRVRDRGPSRGIVSKSCSMSLYFHSCSSRRWPRSRQPEASFAIPEIGRITGPSPFVSNPLHLCKSSSILITPVGQTVGQGEGA